jgi:hypothetical protein
MKIKSDNADLQTRWYGFAIRAFNTSTVIKKSNTYGL